MKKLIKIIGIYLIGLLIMEIALNVLSRNVPDMGGMVVDSLYKSPNISSKLGQLQSFKMNVDSVSQDETAYFITIRINAANTDTTLKGMIVHTDDNWKLKRLSAKSLQ